MVCRRGVGGTQFPRIGRVGIDGWCCAGDSAGWGDLSEFGPRIIVIQLS